VPIAVLIAYTEKGYGTFDPYLYFYPAMPASVCFSDTALLYTLGKKLWGIFIVKNVRIGRVMSRVMRKIDFGIWQKSITGGGLTAPWLLFSRQGAKGQGRRYAARLALDAL